MQRSHTEFVHELIKGKISEIMFQHLFSEHEFATVLPFGCEHTTPLLAKYQLQIPKETLENIRNTPDFILLKPDHADVRFVDVKYQKIHAATSRGCSSWQTRLRRNGLLRGSS